MALRFTRLVICFCIFFMAFMLFPQNNFNFLPEKTSDYGLAVKQCLLDYNDPNLWGGLQRLIHKCLNKYSLLNNHSFFSLDMGRFGEKKYFLPPAVKMAECNWITIGIGGDILVEKQMKQKYPQCKIYGVEPSPDQADGFRKYGTVIPVAVGIKPGNLTMRLRYLTPPKPGLSRYVFEDVEIEPLHTVLDSYVGSRHIDFGTLDIEGFEYPLITALERNKTFAREGVSFCQLDIEFHSLGMETKYRQDSNNEFQFQPFFRSFLRNSPYVPVHSVLFGRHHKVTFVNVEDRRCDNIFEFGQYFIVQ